MQLKLKRMNPREGRPKFNVQQFQDTGTLELYQVTLHNRVQAVQDRETETPGSMEEKWKDQKTIWKAVKKRVRRDKKKYKEDLAQQAEDAAGKNNLTEL